MSEKANENRPILPDAHILFVTVDTEADDQWDPEKPPTTENSRFLPRFQSLCEEYGFYPVWLTDYEMACDSRFSDFAGEKAADGLCEIGMHLHPWTTPPEAALAATTTNRPFLIEYAEDVMDEKIGQMTDMLKSVFGTVPTTHRSGRWAMDERYFRLLSKYGYRVDCSVTPHVDWAPSKGATGMPGTDYSSAPEHPYYTPEGILEIPMTVRRMHVFEKSRVKNARTLIREVRHFVQGTEQWLRAFDTDSDDGLEKLMGRVFSQETGPLMFMLHSSELMPGGSPAFRSKEDVEKLYRMTERVFKTAADHGFKGMTLKGYGEETERLNADDRE
ncbi:MAG: hypothetical protein K6C95_04230 [Lachnospiraceae bacterium]|nr:hypothetical protein [Lachnospiraceae bacterium]